MKQTVELAGMWEAASINDDACEDHHKQKRQRVSKIKTDSEKRIKNLGKVPCFGGPEEEERLRRHQGTCQSFSCLPESEPQEQLGQP
jgi:hypothetical protein